MSKPKIYIGIPTKDNSLATELAMNLIYWSHSDKYNIIIKPIIGICPMENARNQIVKDFLQTDCEYLWWIDDDISPPLDTLDRLMDSIINKPEIDALGATCFSMRSQDNKYYPYPVTLRLNKNSEYEIYYGNGIEEVDGTGGACLIVKRKVYEQIKKPYENLYDEDGILALTCDFNIWRKAQEKGFKLFIDFNILCDHQKKCSIKGFQNTLADLTNE